MSKKSLRRIYFIAVGKPGVERLVEDDLLPLAQLLDNAFMGQMPIDQGLVLMVDVDALRKQLPVNFLYRDTPVLGNAVLIRYNRAGDLLDVTESDIALFQGNSSPVTSDVRLDVASESSGSDGTFT